MTYVTAASRGFVVRDRSSSYWTVFACCAATSCATLACAAWLFYGGPSATSADQSTSDQAASDQATVDHLTRVSWYEEAFDSRLPGDSSSDFSVTSDLKSDSLKSSALKTDLQAAASGIRGRIDQAKSELVQGLEARTRFASLQDSDSVTASVSSSVPLPRSRPTDSLASANADSARNAAADRAAFAAATQADNRTLLQKFFSLLKLPGRVTLASADPDGGIFSNGQDASPGATGYDRLTAVYDISARTVYMPDGTRLEAHSGFGNLLDDPLRVSERNLGATPPNIYDLKPREELFHGVQALRMTPVGDGDTFGRTGLLAHSYMLGPNGDSNGCVSFRNYDAFLKAYQNGDVKRLMVVKSLSNSIIASAGRV